MAAPPPAVGTYGVMEESFQDVMVELDDDDDFVYEEVVVEDPGELPVFDDDFSEDLETAMRSLQGIMTSGAAGGGDFAASALGADAAASSLSLPPREVVAPGEVKRQPEVVDDFIRNFLVKKGLTKTLAEFETEWFELGVRGLLSKTDVSAVPDVYRRNAELEEEVQRLSTELESAREIARQATATWDKFRKERDLHRMHHKRVGQEKNKLVTDMRRLKKHYESYEPTITELRGRYETAMKEKMLTRLERDRLSARVKALEEAAATAAAAKDAEKASGGEDMSAAAGATAPPLKKTTQKKKTTGAAAALPTDMENPFWNVRFEPADVKNLGLTKTFKGHSLAVSAVALHPTKPVCATASDDRTWKMWALPDGELVMAGEGHRDWVSTVAFHPKGLHLASGSGDATVKLWDFQSGTCALTFKEHTHAVWSVAFHLHGDLLLSASLDHSARMWDIVSQRCRTTFRGHVDSVNEVVWQPYAAALATASSDKTVSVWDARTGLCAQTYYGHYNSCNGLAFNLRGDTIASCDADGVVKVWDVRMVAERLSIDVGPHPVSALAIDRSGELVACASDDGRVRVHSLTDGSEQANMLAHDDAVQSLAWDPNGKFLLTGGSDKSFRLFG